ncbi:MAG TPA: MarR family winged helix-turn-helix transcriptional regulator [Solirubrobacteraceae bacterium]|nr:MarR family winged helix-turn-helix transcriptional regulator [Solirubrobacteraceae bacterium]
MAVQAPVSETPSALADCGCLATNLGWLLSQVAHAYATEMAAALAPLGLGSRGYCVLASAIGQELTQTQLASLVGVDKTTMVVTVDELERQGLAERRPSPTDRRAHVIAVTAAGGQKVAAGQEIIDRVQEEILGALPAAERTALLSALTRLLTGRLSEPAECSPPLRRREPR